MFGGRAGLSKCSRVERAAEPVGGEEVEPAVAHERGGAGHRVEHALHGRADALLARAGVDGARRLRCAREVEEVGALGVVELQRAGERLQHALGDAACVAALEPGVVVDADAGEQRDLLAAEPGNAPAPAP